MSTSTEMTPLGSLIRDILRDMLLESLGEPATTPTRQRSKHTTTRRGARKISPAGRKAIGDAARKRWAKYRKTHKTAK